MTYPRTNRYNGGQRRPSAAPRRDWRSEPMTDVQAAKISKELGRRVLDSENADRNQMLVAALLAAVALGQTRDGQPATKGSASDLIDWLMDKPFAQGRGYYNGLTGTETPARSNEITVTEEGFYLFENSAYRVQRTKDGQRLYAKKATPTGWSYEGARGVIFKLAPEMLMSPADIAKYGVEFEFCIVCSTGFERFDSKRLGIGPSCGPKVMGKEGYKAAMDALIAADPEVAAYVEMKKVEAKARKEGRAAADNAAEAALADQDAYEASERYWDAQIQQREAEEDRKVYEAKMARDEWLNRR